MGQKISDYKKLPDASERSIKRRLKREGIPLKTLKGLKIGKIKKLTEEFKKITF